MLDFLTRLFKREGSSTTAKERLRLVLLSDHLSLAPDTVEALKTDLIAVISKYVKVDIENCDVSFEQQSGTVAMHMNIPIVGLQNERAPVAPPVYAKSEPRPLLGEAGEKPYLDDLHTDVMTPASSAAHSEESLDGVEQATRDALGDEHGTAHADANLRDTAGANHL